jgi:hypothetical protein
MPTTTAVPPTMNRFLKLSPLPVKSVSAGARKQRSRATSSRVLTGAEHMKLLQQEEKKEMNANPGTKRKRKNVPPGGDRGDSYNSGQGRKKQKQSEKPKESDKGKKVTKNCEAKKKKQTVRQDKFKNIPLPKSPRKKKQRVSESDSGSDNEDTTPCAGCGEPFFTSTEAWLACTACNAWFELSCAGMLGKTKQQQDQFCVCRLSVTVLIHMLTLFATFADIMNVGPFYPVTGSVFPRLAKNVHFCCIL